LVLIGVTGVHAVRLLHTSSIHTRVFPVESAERVWAIHGKDSLKMTGSEGEYFLNGVSPGSWQVHIEARKPFQNARLKEIMVKPGANRDLGEIWLQR
jgi:hypothetical protein